MDRTMTNSAHANVHHEHCELIQTFSKETTIKQTSAGDLRCGFNTKSGYRWTTLVTKEEQTGGFIRVEPATHKCRDSRFDQCPPRP